MRQLLIYIIFAACLLTTGYEYLPPIQKQSLPPIMRNALYEMNTAFSNGVAIITQFIEHKLPTQTPLSPEAQNFDTAVIKPSSPHSKESLPFLGIEIKNVYFSREDLQGALMDGAKLRNGLFSSSVLNSASGRLADFSGTLFYQTKLNFITAQGALFSDSIFIRCKLNDAFVQHSEFQRSLFRGGQAITTRFDHSQMMHAHFANIDMRRSSFIGVDARWAIFDEVQLHGTKWSGANLSAANFSTTTGLTQRALAGACGDEETLLPPDLPRLPPCPSTVETHLLSGAE